MVEPESEGSGEVWSPGGGRGQRWRLSAVAGVEGSGSMLRVEAPQQHEHLLHRRHRVVVTHLRRPPDGLSRRHRARRGRPDTEAGSPLSDTQERRRHSDS